MLAHALLSHRNILMTLCTACALTALACQDNQDDTPDQGTDAPAADMSATVDMSEAADEPDMKPGEDMRPELDMKPAVEPDMKPAFVYPAPDSWGPNRGPGLPQMSFTQDQLYQNCAYLDGNEKDKDHHNLVVMYDGYVLMPWAHEGQVGGLTFFDMSDPCNPTKAGENWSNNMRETHSIGFARRGDKRYAVVKGIESVFMGGIQFWDITDTSQPEVVTNLNLEGFFYPDAYKRVTLSVFWQGRYVYGAGSLNGVYVVDALDPSAPEQVNQYVFEPLMQTGQVHAVGNLLITTTAEGRRAVLLDISDPTNPMPIPGGDFQIKDGEGVPLEAYFSNMANGHIFFARKEGGGGLIIYDIRDPENPTFAGEYHSDGNGGYVFVKDDHAFVGESSRAVLYDVSDYQDIKEVARFDLQGDLDTITPLGNLAVLSVDDKADANQASAIAPWTTDPDTTAPHVQWVYPNDGDSNLATTSRFGLMFNEMVDVGSAFEGSLRLYRSDAATPDAGRVEILVSTQENIVNVSPTEPLDPNTSYTLEVLANGIIDYSGNALTEAQTYTFTTGN